jgi:hypothetical protein
VGFVQQFGDGGWVYGSCRSTTVVFIDSTLRRSLKGNLDESL